MATIANPEGKPIEIRQLISDDAVPLERFFCAIADDPAVLSYFRPHPFDAETAALVTDPNATGGDVYFGAFEAGEMVGYGMLRGWSEGYDVPSFGVCVHPAERGRGIGALLLSWAIDRAKDRGAFSVMLKVSSDNTTAVRLYESYGFRFSGETMNDQLVGRLRLLP